MSDDFDIHPEDFESHEALGNIADMGLAVYRACKRNGASDSEAFTVTAAFFAGMTKAMYSQDGD